MDSRIPRWFAVIFILFGSAVLGLSVYLERSQLAFLQAHPIMVNLLSGMIGFAYSFLLVAFVINGMVRRSRAGTRRPRLYSAYQKALAAHLSLRRAMPFDIRVRLGGDGLEVPQLDGSVPLEMDLDEIARGTRTFLARIDELIESSTRLFELLVLPDEEIANYLMFVADDREGFRTFVQEHDPEEPRRTNQRRLGDSNLRPILIHYHLTMTTISKMHKQIAKHPEVRRCHNPPG